MRHTIGTLWKWFWSPSRRFAWGAIFIVGGIAGIIFWGGFNTAMEATNTLRFCVSCHEMADNVGSEYETTVHFQNGSGVRATCSDCHVPDPWVYKVVRKIKASNELYHAALGTIDTPDKFEAKRLTLAKNVWKQMKETDSRECRNCHSWEAMMDSKQKLRAAKQHANARKEGGTCIDCHKGIAHRAVHVLLNDADNPYDGKPDSRHLPSKKDEAKAKADAVAKAAQEAQEAKARMASAAPVPQTAAPAATSPAAQATAGSGGDWSAIPIRDLVVFYPGQASMEWVLTGSDHGGARAVKKMGDTCRSCHDGEHQAMGKKIAAGEKIEATPIPGKRGSIPVKIQARHDGQQVTFRVTWPAGQHTPVPFVQGGKMDPGNQVKLAMMIDDGKIDGASSAGCWVTCHHDSRYMPDHPGVDVLGKGGDIVKRIDAGGGVTKYLKETRTEIEVSNSPRGGWNKLADQAVIDKLRADGAYMDLARVRSGGPAEAGSVLDHRQNAVSKDVTGGIKLEGSNWVAVLSRPLKAMQPGGVTIEPGKVYTVGFAIHDDYTAARFHHVSMEYKFGLDDDKAEINAVKK